MTLTQVSVSLQKSKGSRVNAAENDTAGFVGSAPGLSTLAVVLSAPEQLELRHLALTAPGPEDVVVDVEWSGISTGTERLLWSGRMPPFPGLGYPLVPGYESVGEVRYAGPQSGRHVGERVFVPGARCFGEIRGLFGGAAGRLRGFDLVILDGDRIALNEVYVHMMPA